MRRIQIILSVVILLVTLSGCGNQKVQNNNNHKDTATTDSTINNQENTNTDAKDNNYATSKDSGNTNNNKQDSTDTNANKTENSNSSPQTTDKESNKDQQSFYGNWKINKIAGYGKISGNEMHELIGLKLYLSKDLITLGSDSYDTPKYQIRNRTKSDIESSYRTNFSNLGITGDSITEVNILDKNGAQTMTLIIKDNNTLFYFNEGVYYEATRIS